MTAREINRLALLASDDFGVDRLASLAQNGDETEMTQGAGNDLRIGVARPRNLMTRRVEHPQKPGPKHQTAKQKQIARETMLRLHKEGRLRRGRTPPANPLPKPAQSSPAPAAKPDFMTVQPDTELFGTENVPPPRMDAPPPSGSLPPGGQPGGTPPPGPEQQPSGMHTTVLPKDTRALAVMVWTMILNLLAVIFGPAMYPRKVGNGPNEVPYDENEMVIGAWMDYFASIGLKPFSPLVNLLLSILAYMLPRAQFVILTVKKWFSPRAAAQRGGHKPQSDEPTPPAEPPPTPESPSAPPTPAPPEPVTGKLATREEAAAALDELG